MPVSTAQDNHNDDHSEGDSAKDRQRDNAMKVRDERQEMANEIERVKATLEYRIELVKLEAKFLEGRFEGLVEAGFNESQAMTFLLHGWGSEG